MCLAYNAGVVPRLESTQAMQEQAPVIAKYVKQLLQQQSHKGKGPVQTYIELIKNLLSAIGGKSETGYCVEFIRGTSSCEVGERNKSS